MKILMLFVWAIVVSEVGYHYTTTGAMLNHETAGVFMMLGFLLALILIPEK